MSFAADALPPLPASFERADLEAAAFTGWLTWSQLRSSGYEQVPCQPGVYVVYRESTAAPQFSASSSGGWFKGRDPSVGAQRLKAEWVPRAQVLYIGKADIRRRRKEVEALRERVSEFGRFGAGEAIAHWGGRLIWQLAGAGNLLVAWRAITWTEPPRDFEKRLLARFAELHDGRRPFANLTG